MMQGGLIGEGAALSTMMLSFGSIGVITLLWSWIGVGDGCHLIVGLKIPYSTLAFSFSSLAWRLVQAFLRGSLEMPRMGR
jgi:hypothetical protein